LIKGKIILEGAARNGLFNVRHK